VKTAKNSKLPKLPETILSQLEKVGGHRYPPGSHSLHPRHEDRHISFGDKHPETSAAKAKTPIKANSKVPKVTKSQESGQRKIASHKKCDF
jgi:hypothetical protein